MNADLKCPKCGHAGLQRMGKIITNVAGDHVKQQWRCKFCRRRTLNPVEVK